ncbi:hypothetical protein BKA69DRAFT_1066252 [Paraphysoderma sedebokerense]|nr:hypothetical protein BKA69DRAFT_1066252 [Paraphysoderma sedebokerense]
MFAKFDTAFLSLLLLLVSSTDGRISPQQLAALRASTTSNAPMQLQAATPATIEMTCPASGLVMRVRRRSPQSVGPGRRINFDPSSTADYRRELPEQYQFGISSCYTFIGFHGTCGAGAAKSIEKAIMPQPRTATNHGELQLGNGFYVAADSFVAGEFGERACNNTRQNTASKIICSVFMETSVFDTMMKLNVPQQISYHGETRGLWYDEQYLSRWKKRNRVQADAILFSEIAAGKSVIKDTWQMVIPESRFRSLVAKCSNAPVDQEIPYPQLMKSAWDVKSYGRNAMPNPPIGDNLDLRK